MAGPHIAGAMALLWSAIPGLQNQIDASRTAMNNAAHFISSTQCGTEGPPNNADGGPGGYFCGCQWRISNPDSDRDSNSDCNTYSDAHRYSDEHSYSYSNAQTDAHAQVCGDTEASSHTAAETVAVFAKANIVAIDDRLMRSVLLDFAPLRVPAAASRAQSPPEKVKIVLTRLCRFR